MACILTNEVILLQTQSDLVLELRIQEHVATSGVETFVVDERHVVHGHLDDAFAEAALKDLRVFADDRLQDANERMQSIGRRADRRELRVIATDALAAVQPQIELLAFVQFADQNVVEHRPRRIVLEALLLIADRYPLQVLRVHVPVHVEILGQYAVLRRIRILRALHFQLEDQRVLLSAVQVVDWLREEKEMSWTVF